MKKTFMCLVIILFAAVVYSENKKPAFTTKRVENFKIDGYLKEKIKIKPIKLSSENPSNLSAEFYPAFTGSAFYIFIRVKDDKPGVNSNKRGEIWNGDGIEILLSSDAGKDPLRTEMTSKDHRIGITASNPPKSWNYNLKAPLSRADIKYRKTGDGYIIEALIPWFNFKKGCSCKLYNRPTAFNCAVNDADGKKRRETHIRWCGDYSYSVNPSQWGALTFSTR